MSDESEDEGLLAVKEHLQCPICFNYMFAPIRQCRTGHSFCDQCFIKLKRCPECRASKSEARSYKLEAIASKLSFPCRNKHVGCPYKNKGEAVTNHEKFCRFGIIYCPFKKYDSCTWHDYRNQLHLHCSRKHKNNFYSRQKQKFLAKNFVEINNYHYIYVLIHTFGEFFRLTWELDDVTMLTRWSVMYMGSTEDAKKFSYKIEFPQQADKDYSDVSRNLTWKSPCEILPEEDSEKFSGHNYAIIHRNFLKSYCDENGDLNYTVQIYKSIHCDAESDNDDQNSDMEDDADEELRGAKGERDDESSDVE